MRSLLLPVLSSLLLAGPARADSIALYADAGAGACAKPSVPFQVNTVYVFHTQATGAAGSSWRIENTSGMAGLGSTCGQLVISGDVFTGISVSYGGCLAGTFPICQVELLSLTAGPIPDCYQLNVRGYPGDTPLVSDCSDNETPATGGFFTFDIEGKPCWDCTTPVESSTWGRVKAMYR
ncbi:MAG TPA: hypothetical protein VFT13_07560 [Candidatus Krumholzibacteria bacterium]|nr:hypothetical protein [Candidatus Krumholzibacteria bacterium]